MAFPNIRSEDDDERICAVLSPNTKCDDDWEPPSVSDETLEAYYNYLLSLIIKNTKLTGRETMGVFSWEEKYNWGAGSKKEYQELKINLPCCQDKYLFLKLCEQWDEETGLEAKVKRTSDNKSFTIPLQDLSICDEKMDMHQIINDYAVWFVNYQY